MHNQGYAHLRQRQLKLALRCFEKAATLLKIRYPHEAIFPLNNIAFVHILRGNGAEAENLLTSCLFRQLWPEYEASILVNFAYTRWLLGREDAENFLDRIQKAPGLDGYDWALWQIEYARALFRLLPISGKPSKKIAEHVWKRIQALRSVAAISPYWNALTDELKRRHQINLPHLPIEDAHSVMSEVADPSLSILRPSVLCFAHV